METLNFEDIEVKKAIRKDNTQKQPKYYAVLQNPYIVYHSTEIIFGGTEEIVRNKCLRQLKKWRKKNEII